VLVGKPEGKRPFRRSKYRWEELLWWIFSKWDGGGAWNGLISLKIGSGGRHL
jgi:hypothetical protein